jgi:ABC-type transport system involved in cytochrome bd biosynthesis fused ATPase/permease subunit
MKKVAYQVLNFILFGNFFISLCAVAQALVTYSFFSLKPSIVVLSFLFFATLTIYNFSLLKSKTTNSTNFKNTRKNWFFAK